MESSILVGLIEILKEALKIFGKNGRKIMAFIAIFTILTKSTLYFSNFFSIKPLIADLIIERNLLHFTTPQSPGFKDILTHIRNDVKIIFVVEFFYVVLGLATFLLSATATIIAAAITHGGKEDLSLKDLLSRIAKTWKRPVITWLYTTFLGLIYFCIYFALLLSILQAIKSQTISSPGGIILLGFAAMFISGSGLVWFLYLSLIWSLAFIISAVEEIRGIEAVRKAKQISKGMMRQGIILSILLSVVTTVVLQGINMISKSSLAVQMIISLAVLISSGLLRMYWYVAFTVFYYKCKKFHGERVVILEEMLDGYTKIPATTTVPLVDSNIP